MTHITEERWTDCTPTGSVDPRNRTQSEGPRQDEIKKMRGRVTSDFFFFFVEWCEDVRKNLLKLPERITLLMN